MRLIPRFDVVFAERCAWRAVYVYAYRRVPGLPPNAMAPGYFARDPKCFHLGIDPVSPAHVFGSVLGRSFRFKVGSVWSFTESRIRRSWRLWLSSLDGRFPVELRQEIRQGIVDLWRTR